MRIYFIISILTVIAHSVVAQDSTDQKDTTKTHLTDTLKTKAQEHLPDSIELANNAKQEAKESLKEELDTSIPTDSSEVVKKAESIATQTINNETDININGIPKDSTEIANKAEQIGKEELEKAGVEVNGIPKDSTEIANKVNQLTTEELNKAGIEISDIPTDSAAVKNEAK